MKGFKIGWLMGCALAGLTGSAQAQLVTQPDVYGIPYGNDLVVEAPGLLDNDTFNGEPAGGVAIIDNVVSDAVYGTLVVNPDGSFSYAPGLDFPGIDSFTYQAAVGVETSTASVTLTACSGGPSVFTCWKEASYLAKIGELGYGTFQEGFEDDAAWASVREPTTAMSVVSLGITWQTNHPDPPASNGITTGPGAAWTGLWGVYDPKHGYATGNAGECDVDVPPPQCLYKDGLTGTRLAGESTLYGVGAYFSGSFGPKLVMILNGGAPIGLGLVPVGDPTFFGVIDTAGFTTFRVEETDGKIGQVRLVFADDFTFAHDDPSTIFVDGFESGGTLAWSATVP